LHFFVSGFTQLLVYKDLQVDGVKLGNVTASVEIKYLLTEEIYYLWKKQQ
jgi:hypothetical protein